AGRRRPGRCGPGGAAGCVATGARGLPVQGSWTTPGCAVGGGGDVDAAASGQRDLADVLGRTGGRKADGEGSDEQAAGSRVTGQAVGPEVHALLPGGKLQWRLEGAALDDLERVGTRHRHQPGAPLADRVCAGGTLG